MHWWDHPRLNIVSDFGRSPLIQLLPLQCHYVCVRESMCICVLKYIYIYIYARTGAGGLGGCVGAWLVCVCGGADGRAFVCRGVRGAIHRGAAAAIHRGAAAAIRMNATKSHCDYQSLGQGDLWHPPADEGDI